MQSQVALNVSAQAGSLSNNAEVISDAVDRFLGGVGIALTIISGTVATLSMGETFSAMVQIQDSPDQGNWSDFGAPIRWDPIATGGPLPLPQTGVSQHGGSCATAQQFMRIKITPSLSASTQDTGTLNCTFLVYG